MATWTEISVDARKAAALLLAKGRYRSSISRSYYAAYAATVAELRKARSIRFPYGDNNPRHQKLPEYIREIFPLLHRDSQFVALSERVIRNLWRDRIDADYAPQRELGEPDARSCLKEAESLMIGLGLIP